MSHTLTKAWRFRKPLSDATGRPCKVLLAGPHFQGGAFALETALKERQLNHDKVQLLPAPTPLQVLQYAPTADIAIPFMERFDSNFFEQATKLRLCIQFGVGLEGVAMETATNLGIAVSNIPAHQTGNAEATSEHALYLTMSLLRFAPDDLARRFASKQLGGLPQPRSLIGRRVTVVGYGSVGKVLTKYLVTLGAHVTVVRNREWEATTSSSDDDSLSVAFRKAKSLKDALPSTDILILACFLSPETLHIVNEDAIRLLPRGALLVNVGRGPLVEYEAIRQALASKHVGGYASDVGVGHPTKPSEPWDPDDALSQMSNTLFTPHVGGYTDYTYERMASSIAEAIDDVRQGKPPKVWVNQDL